VGGFSFEINHGAVKLKAMYVGFAGGPVPGDNADSGQWVTTIAPSEDFHCSHE
jgi:hypothetical protein